MNTDTLLSRRTLLKAAPVAAAAVAVPAIAAQPEASRLPEKIAAYERAKVAAGAAVIAVSAAYDALDAMGPILVPIGLLPDGRSPNGWRDLAITNEHALAAEICDEAEKAKARLCSAYIEALAPGRNADVIAGIDAMRDRSLAALAAAKNLSHQRELQHDLPALSEADYQATEELKAATVAILLLVPITPEEGLQKAAWLHGFLHERKGHMVVQELDAIIASIGGVRLPSFAEGL